MFDSLCPIALKYIQDSSAAIISQMRHFLELNLAKFSLQNLTRFSQIKEHLRIIPKEEYLKTFQKYLERMQLCINNRGDYIEHLIK